MGCECVGGGVGGESAGAVAICSEQHGSAAAVLRTLGAKRQCHRQTVRYYTATACHKPTRIAHHPIAARRCACARASVAGK